MKTGKPDDPKSQILAELVKERYRIGPGYRGEAGRRLMPTNSNDKPITLTTCRRCGAHRYTGVSSGLTIHADLEPFTSIEEEAQARKAGRYTFAMQNSDKGVYLLYRSNTDLALRPAGQYLVLGYHRCESPQARTMPTVEGAS